MRLSILVLSLVPISYASPFTLRQNSPNLAPQLLTTITNLNTAVTDLKSAVNNFSGSFLHILPEAFAVMRADTEVDTTVLNAIFITKDSSAFLADESKEIVQALASQIGPMQGSLNALKEKYPEFKKTLISPIVLLALQTLRKHTDDLLDVLTEKITPDDAGLLGFGKTILDGAFEDAVAVYRV